MSRIVFIRAFPLDPATMATVPVYLAGGGARRSYRLGGVQYRDGVVREPRFSARLGYGEGGWTGATMPSASPIRFQPADPALLDMLTRLYWRDAAIEIDAGPEDGALVRRLTGTVADATIDEGALVITAADASVRLAKPLAPDLFAGTGGLEGAEVAKGRRKRRTLGRAFNVEGFLLDPAYQIYEFGDPGRPVAGCLALRDRGRDGAFAILADAGSPAATLTALRAAVPVEGGGIFAPSINCARWWTDPAGPLTADILGEVGAGEGGKASDIATAWLAGTGISLADPSALAALRPALCTDHVDDETTAAQALDRLFLGLSLCWIAQPSGSIAVRPWSFSAPATTLRAEYVGREASLPPVRQRKLGYKRNQRRHGDGEISIAVPAGSADAAIGTNAIVNSEYIAGLAGHHPGWDGDTGLTISRGVNLSADWSGILNVAWARANGTPSAGSVFDGYHTREGGVESLARWCLSVLPGDRVYFSGLGAPHRCEGAFLCVWMDGAGAGIGHVEAPHIPASALNFANGDPANAVRVGAFATAPAGARWCYLLPRAFATGGSDPYLFWSQLFLARVGPDQTEPPLYMPGPSDRAADVTADAPAFQTLVGRVNNIASDAILSAAEKPALQREWQALDSNHGQLHAKAAALGIAGGERAAASAAMNALWAYLGSLVPGWTDMGADTPIGSAYFANMWAVANDAVNALQAAIQGAPGDPGVSALVVSCEPPAISVPCSFNGVPKDAVPGFQIRITQAGVDVTAAAAYGAPVGTNISAPSVSGSGAVSVGGITGDKGSVRIPISHGGATAEASVAYGKVRDGSAANRGEVAIASLGGAASWVTSASFDLMVAPGFVMTMSAFVDYQASTASYQPQIKLAIINLTDAGAEEDISGSLVTGDVVYPGEPSGVTTAGSWANGTLIAKVIRVMLKSRRNAGVGGAAGVSGSLGGSI